MARKWDEARMRGMSVLERKSYWRWMDGWVERRGGEHDENEIGTGIASSLWVPLFVIV